MIKPNLKRAFYGKSRELFIKDLELKDDKDILIYFTETGDFEYLDSKGNILAKGKDEQKYFITLSGHNKDGIIENTTSHVIPI